MVGFKIIALNDRGKKVLAQTIKENQDELDKKSLVDRMKFNAIWNRKVSVDPYSESWTVNPNALRILKLDPNFNIRAIVLEVNLALIANGGRKNIDYKIEIKNG